jgi:hypothetical protein
MMYGVSLNDGLRTRPPAFPSPLLSLRDHDFSDAIFCPTMKTKFNALYIL